MANLTDLTELDQWWGSDLSVTLTGDLAVVGVAQAGQILKSQQRVTRRLMTNPTQYLFEQDYGAGVPQQIGENQDDAAIQSLISGQMQLEASVQQTPPPNVVVASITDGVEVSVVYTVAPEAVPATLSFTAEA
jgi:hypothetical protein